MAANSLISNLAVEPSKVDEIDDYKQRDAVQASLDQGDSLEGLRDEQQQKQDRKDSL
jgi:hypothetical protein